MITRTLVDFTRNPKYFIENMNTINDLIIYYIDENNKLIFDKNIDINLDKELYIDEINNIKNNLKKHTLNKELLNIYKSNNTNKILIDILIQLIKLNDTLLSKIQRKSDNNDKNKSDTQPIYISLLENYFNYNDNIGLLQIIKNIDSIPDKDIEVLYNILITKLKYTDTIVDSYVYSSNTLLNINNINVAKNVLNPIVISIMDKYLSYIYDINTNDIKFNKSLLFWRSLQIYKYNIFLSSHIDKEIQNFTIDKKLYLLFNLYSMLLDEKFINDLILFLNNNKYIEINKIPEKISKLEKSTIQNSTLDIHEIKNKLSFDFL
jgi:hypothetical protein